MIGNIIDDKEVQDQVGYEKYDIVTANILADVLVPLTPVIVAQMKKGAYYITSGILDVKRRCRSEGCKRRRSDFLEGDSSGRVGICDSKKGTDLMQRFFVEPHQIDGEQT